MQITENLENLLREILRQAGTGGLESVLQKVHASVSREGPACAPEASAGLKQILEAVGANEEGAQALRSLLILLRTSPVDAAELKTRLEELRTGSAQLLKALDETILGDPKKLADFLRVSSCGDPERILDVLKAVEKAFQPIEKLVEILKSLPEFSGAITSQDTEMLQRVIRGHLNSVQSMDRELKIALAGIFADNPLQTLLVTLERAMKSIPSPASGIEHRFLQFVGDLHKELSVMVREFPATADRLRMVLKDALEAVQIEFPEGQTAGELPRSAAVLLRSVDMQIKAVLQIPDRDLAVLFEGMQSQAVTGANAVKDLMALFEQLREVGIRTGGPSGMELIRLADLFMEIVEGPTESGRIREGLNRIAEGLRGALLNECLKSIEISLTSLVENIDNQAPGLKIPVILHNPFFAELVHHLADLLQMDLPDPVIQKYPSLPDFLKEFTRRLRDAVRSENPSEDLDRILRDGLKEVRQMTGRNETDPERGPVKAPAVGVLRQIERQIREALELLERVRDQSLSLPGPDGQIHKSETLPGGIVSGREQERLQQFMPGQPNFDRLEQRAFLMKDPAVVLILRLLKASDWSPHGGGLTGEKEFVDFLKDMARRLPVKETRGTSGEIPSRRDLEEGFSKLEQQFRSEHSGAQDSGSGRVRNPVAMVEQMLRGHELLDRLNPLMNMLGEPAFLLFPAIIHGFASELEMTLYPGRPQEAGEDEEEESEERKRSKGYRRFEFEIQLPGLGRVQSRASFRTGEFLLDLTAENETAAAFLEERSGRLKSVLLASGYERIEFRVSAAPFTEIRPGWMPVLLSGKSTSSF